MPSAYQALRFRACSIVGLLPSGSDGLEADEHLSDGLAHVRFHEREVPDRYCRGDNMAATRDPALNPPNGFIPFPTPVNAAATIRGTIITKLTMPRRMWSMRRARNLVPRSAGAPDSAGRCRG